MNEVVTFLHEWWKEIATIVIVFFFSRKWKKGIYEKLREQIEEDLRDEFIRIAYQNGNPIYNIFERLERIEKLLKHRRGKRNPNTPDR